MTWAFIYLAALLVGLAVFGTLAPSQRQAVGGEASGRGVRLAGAGLAGFGAVGLGIVGLGDIGPEPTFIGALAGAVIALIAYAALSRRARLSAPSSGGATVVRAMAPGGYGQIRLDQGDQIVVMAALNVDAAPLEEGERVEIVPSSRSVIEVRRAR